MMMSNLQDCTTSEVMYGLNVDNSVDNDDDDSQHAEKKVEKLDYFGSPSVDDTEVKDNEILYDTQKPLAKEKKVEKLDYFESPSVDDTEVKHNEILYDTQKPLAKGDSILGASEIQEIEPIEGNATEEPFDKIIATTSDVVKSDHSVDNAVDDNNKSNNKHAENAMNIAPSVLGSGLSLQSVKFKPATRSNNRVSLHSGADDDDSSDTSNLLSEEENKKLEKVQQLRIKFLRLIERLGKGFTPQELKAAQLLITGMRQISSSQLQFISLDDAIRSASQLEAERKGKEDDLDFSVNILVLGKSGVGKSATINSIFGEAKAKTSSINIYEAATTSVTEIVGMVGGVKIRVFDTPGLKSYAGEQNFNRKVLSKVKKKLFTKKSSPDIVLFVDRLDTLKSRNNLNDLPLLKTITDVLGSSIWQNTIVTLTHAASAPPDGPSGSPIGYYAFVAQQSLIVQLTIGQAVNDHLHLMNPNPVSLVENHPSCRKNVRDGEKVLPNGQSWRPQLLLLCYSMKILSEAANLYETQDKKGNDDRRKLLSSLFRSPPPFPYLSSLLQSRSHPKLSPDNGDYDIGELANLSDSDIDKDEYDELPPFKPLKKSQIDKLSREHREAYFDEYDYREKLLKKKQWREERKRMRDMKRKGKASVNHYNDMEDLDDQKNGSPVPLPDLDFPPSFDSDNAAYRYRSFLDPKSRFLPRTVLDPHGWNHDCGYDCVILEKTQDIINKFPAAVTAQITKDKKDFSIHLDSSVSAKHGENGSTMVGFDIQNFGEKLAYTFRGETKYKNFKRNKTAAGVSVMFLGENVTTGLKIENQIALGKRLVLAGSTGTMQCQGDSAYGANVEVRIKEADFPIGQNQYSFVLSLMKWKGVLDLGANFVSQISIGRNYKMAVNAGLNNNMKGHVSVKISSSSQLQIALIAILPILRAIYKKFWPGARGRENDSICYLENDCY